MLLAHLNKKRSPPLLDHSLIGMELAVREVGVDATDGRVDGGGRHEGRLGQEAGGLRARHVEERLAHAGVALDAHAGSGQPSSA